jgi:hypothetical protein
MALEPMIGAAGVRRGGGNRRRIENHENAIRLGTEFVPELCRDYNNHTKVYMMCPVKGDLPRKLILILTFLVRLLGDSSNLLEATQAAPLCFVKDYSKVQPVRLGA